LENERGRQKEREREREIEKEGSNQFCNGCPQFAAPTWLQYHFCSHVVVATCKMQSIDKIQIHGRVRDPILHPVSIFKFQARNYGSSADMRAISKATTV